jgi:hypothetical protein
LLQISERLKHEQARATQLEHELQEKQRALSQKEEDLRSMHLKKGRFLTLIKQAKEALEESK